MITICFQNFLSLALQLATDFYPRNGIFSYNISYEVCHAISHLLTVNCAQTFKVFNIVILIFNFVLYLRAQMYHILKVSAFICNFISTPRNRLPLKTIRNITSNNEPNKLNCVVYVMFFELFIITSIVKNGDRLFILETKSIII